MKVTLYFIFSSALYRAVSNFVFFLYTSLMLHTLTRISGVKYFGRLCLLTEKTFFFRLIWHRSEGEKCFPLFSTFGSFSGIGDLKFHSEKKICLLFIINFPSLPRLWLLIFHPAAEWGRKKERYMMVIKTWLQLVRSTLFQYANICWTNISWTLYRRERRKFVVAFKLAWKWSKHVQHRQMKCVYIGFTWKINGYN